MKKLYFSYKDSYKNGRCKKFRTLDEEFILPTAIDILESISTVDGFAKQLQPVSLANYTVGHRIGEITKDVQQKRCLSYFLRSILRWNVTNKRITFLQNIRNHSNSPLMLIHYLGYTKTYKHL